MSGTFSCPSCGAQYTFDQVSPGQTFACGACEATVTAPDSAPSAPEPVAPNAAPEASRAAPSRPRPATRAGGARRPAASAGAGRSGAARRPAKAQAGPNKALLFGGIGGGAVLLVVLIAVFAASSDDGPTGEGAGAEGETVQTIDPREAVDTALEAAKEAHDVTTAEGMWEAWEALSAQVEAWQDEPEYGRLAANLLLKEAIRFRDGLLEKDPDFAPLRELRGERKYADALEPYVDASWLPERHRNDAKELHERFEKVAGENGWMKADSSLWARLESFEEKVAEAKAAHEELMASPFYSKAKSMENEILADLDQRFENEPRWKGATMHVVEPYVFFVQNDLSWDTLSVAQSRARTLLSLQEIILHEWQDRLDLKPIEEPVPVLMFRGQKQYNIYSGSPEGSGALAHFEPNTGRMAVHDDCDHNTIMHEGTHQLFFAYIGRATGTKVSATMQSYWFQEGMAEWYGNANREQAEDGGWEYEIGRVDPGRMHSIEVVTGRDEDTRKKLFTINELLPVLYADKPKIGAEGRTGLIYAQSWFLIFFLNRFNVDSEGYVHPDEPGIYKDRWEKYVAGELEGRTGRRAFMEAMELDEEGLRQMEIEYWRFFEYVRKKIAAGEVKDKELLAWHEVEIVNRRTGEKLTGEKENDLLPPFDPQSVPPALSAGGR